MLIEIWSDVVCPWCFIGKRRLEKALASLVSTGSTTEGHGSTTEGQGSITESDVEIVYRSFELDPSSPRVATETVAEHLGAKYGGGVEAGRKMVEQVEAVAAEEGLLFRLADGKRANTVDAHRLLHLALALDHEQGGDTQLRLKEELLSSYFLRAENPADHDVLLRAATSVGIDEVAAKEVLAGDAYADAVEADVRRAVAYGATGVPFFVIDQKYGISGAQPVEVFTDVLEKAWADSHPLPLDMAAGADTADGTCGPDGCAI
jgi:predicted DsbA family dithiol-disulfide isomerase